MRQRTEAIKESLVKLEAGLACIDWCLPRLSVAYKIAEAHHLLLPLVNNKQLALLPKMTQKLVSEIDQLQENFSQEACGIQED